MASTCLIGATGLVGSNILSSLLAVPGVSNVHVLARRDPKVSAASDKLHPIIAESTEWPSKLATITPTPSVFFSALGTTRAAAGSFENQYKIDHDLNLEVAKAAKEAGFKTYVLISSSGASATSMFAYPKMKGELEDAVKDLGFEHTVIVRPGLIIGPRDHMRLAEGVLQTTAKFVGKIYGSAKDAVSQDADVIAKAAINAGLKCAEGGDVPKVWVVGQSEIVKLGRTEWKQ